MILNDGMIHVPGYASSLPVDLGFEWDTPIVIVSSMKTETV